VLLGAGVVGLALAAGWLASRPAPGQDVLAREGERARELDRLSAAVRQRIEVKWALTGQLVEGRLSLAEAIDRVAPLGDEPGAEVGRSLIRWAACHLQDDSDRALEVVVRLVEELHEYLLRAGAG
jgi:hypothetical protein